MTIDEIFITLKDGSIAYGELSNRTQDAKDVESWIKAVRTQCDEGSLIYQRCKEAMDGLKVLLEKQLEDIEAEKMYDYTLDMYIENWGDTLLLRMCADKVLEYYIKKESKPKILTLHMILGYAIVDLARIDRKRYLPTAVDHYKAVTEFRNDSIILFDSSLAKRVITAFYNICVVLSSIVDSYVPTAWEYYDILKEWRTSKIYHELMERYEFLIEEVDDIDTYFFGSMFDINPSYNSEILERYVEEKWKEMNVSSVTEIPVEECDNYISHLKMEFRHHPEKALFIYNELKEYYENKKNEIPGEEYITGFYTSSMDTLRVLLSASGMTGEERIREQNYLKDQMIEYIGKEQHSSVSNSILTECIPDLLFKYHFLDLYETTEEKTDLLFTMFVKRHISTYLHSNMVSIFASAIATKAIRSCPEIFIGVMDTSTAEDVIKKSNEIVELIKRHALLHDIGKIGIQEIVSRQYRPITDEEFSILKSHPSIGYEYLSSVPGLEQFADTALLHHKFYDSRGGYPYDGPSKSNVKIIADIITLSDCLDAATDNMGRNYRRVKTVDTVIEEFKKDAGTRYNPVLSDLLSNDMELQEELSRIAVEKREELFLSIYNEL